VVGASGTLAANKGTSKQKRFPFFMIMIWTLYPSISGLAIPSAYWHFEIAKTLCGRMELFG